MKIRIYLSFILLGLGLGSCNFLFGTKKNKTVDEIFKEGRIDPSFIPDKVGYVPILPVWNNFSQPTDIIIGYDEMVYVVDINGLHVLDQTGAEFKRISIPGAVRVCQDRALHTYVTGRVIKNYKGKDYNLPAIFHMMNTGSSGSPVFLDTLIHPFDDPTRNNIGPRPEDEQVEYTGIATRADNILCVARRGPVNNISSAALPDNSIIFFNHKGQFEGYARGLSSKVPNLKSIVNISAIASFATAPQRINGVNETHDLVIAQADGNSNRGIEYSALWLKENYDPDLGITYGENSSLLSKDTSKATSFFYASHRFHNPLDVWVATDVNGYIFVVDSELDSLYQFTRAGFEGVTPPAGSKFRKNVKVSFGGHGSGPYQFNHPSGVCYFGKTVYVADRDNNRIIRYKLSTDIE